MYFDPHPGTCFHHQSPELHIEAFLIGQVYGSGFLMDTLELGDLAILIDPEERLCQGAPPPSRLVILV